jgi:hypothetical protein
VCIDFFTISEEWLGGSHHVEVYETRNEDRSLCIVTASIPRGSLADHSIIQVVNPKSFRMVKEKSCTSCIEALAIDGDEHANQDEEQRAHAAEPSARRQHLFEEDENRNGGDPKQIHHPTDK